MRLTGKLSVKSKVWIYGIIVLACVEFLLHRRIPYMMDDLWYATNLVTGEALQGLGDILESQIWHFFHWGGRSITHGLLQLILMLPEWAADVINLGMTLLLARIMCVIAGHRESYWFFTASALLVALNANWKMSMFWQAGTVNYVYSSVWIFVFLWLYLRQMENPALAPLPGISVWILPLGLIAGWSNENMGPVTFLVALGTLLYLRFGKKEKPESWIWMAEGALTSLLGSILVIAAPGNFVRSSTIATQGILQTIWERLYSMITAGTDYLFISALLTVAVLLLYIVCAGERLSASQWTLLGVAVLSFGAMVLSPHYPDRATFGTMVACIVLVMSILGDLLEKHPRIFPGMAVFTVSMWLYAILRLLNGFYYFTV